MTTGKPATRQAVAEFFGTAGECAIRETALLLIGSEDERRAIRWLGTALYPRALEPPATSEADFSLRPALGAAAKDLAALVEFLRDLTPDGDPCDVTFAALAHRCAETLDTVRQTLAEAAVDPSADAGSTRISNPS